MDESDEDESDENFELDVRVWRCRARVPAVTVWTAPPTSFKLLTMEGLARSMFNQCGNTSFWVGANTQPKNILESFALDVFWYHASRCLWSRKTIDRLGTAAGAEYWVQKRVPSLPTKARSINWHFDKDENLFDASDLIVHPLVSTVTYFGHCGAPLVVLTQPTLNTGSDGASLPEGPKPSSDAFVIFPKPQRHVAFRGNLLHGCPVELEEQKGERLSLLVNVWLRHRPLDLNHSPKLPSKHCINVKRNRCAPPQKILRPARVCKGEELPIMFHPHQLSGLQLPRDGRVTGGSDFLVVRQAPGQLVVSTPQRRSTRSGLTLKRPCARPMAVHARVAKKPEARQRY